jgi:diguanylate cyclase (GGDEF)-like protein
MTLIVLPYGWFFSSVRSPFTLGYAFIVLISLCHFYEGIKRIIGGIMIMAISATMIILGVVKGELFPVVEDHQFIINVIFQIPLIFGIAMFLLGSFTNKLKEKNAELQIASYSDDLTGLYNRRYIYEYLENLELISDGNKNIIVGIIDIAHFKKINEIYGHLKGDHVLKYVGNNIKSICGEDSIVGRVGGDEFIVIIKNFNRFSVDEFIERFEKTDIVFQQDIDNKISHISICGGFVTCSKKTSIDTMLSKADWNMYAAKDKLKNKMKNQLMNEIVFSKLI